MGPGGAWVTGTSDPVSHKYYEENNGLETSFQKAKQTTQQQKLSFSLSNHNAFDPLDEQSNARGWKPITLTGKSQIFGKPFSVCFRFLGLLRVSNNTWASVSHILVKRVNGLRVYPALKVPCQSVADAGRRHKAPGPETLHVTTHSRPEPFLVSVCCVFMCVVVLIYEVQIRSAFSMVFTPAFCDKNVSFCFMGCWQSCVKSF